MLALCLMLLVAYYAYYYAGIIGRGLTMIPINCKIINFSLYLFVWEIAIISSWRASNKLLVKNLLASTLRINSLSAHYAVRTT